MSANRAKNSKPELALRKALWHAGFRGYRLHYKKAPGRPDIAFVSRKIAIYLNGCYWHRCPKCPRQIFLKLRSSDLFVATGKALRNPG